VLPVALHAQQGSFQEVSSLCVPCVLPDLTAHHRPLPAVSVRQGRRALLERLHARDVPRGRFSHRLVKDLAYPVLRALIRELQVQLRALPVHLGLIKR